MRCDFHKESHSRGSLAEVFTADFQIYRIRGGGMTQRRQKYIECVIQLGEAG